MNLINVASQSSSFDIDVLHAIVSFIACVGLCPLLLLEHSRSIRPSDLAVTYLVPSLGCDFIRLGQLADENGVTPTTSLLVMSSCIGTVLLVMESKGKATLLKDNRGQWPPEQLAGMINRTTLWWINSILVLGNRRILTMDNLPPIDQELSSETLRLRALQTWDQRAKPEGKLTLPTVIARSMLPQFLSPVIPRLFLILFRYAQPVLISTAIKSISMSPEQPGESGNTVVIMAVIIYAGLAISKTAYQRRLNRLKIMIRGAVVGIINNKSLAQLSSGSNDGRAVTLMSTDSANICQSASMFHETWAHFVEVLLGMGLLAREVGWVFPVPLVIIFFCSRMSRYLAKNLQSRQKDWNVATQERIAMTTSMLGSMKDLKMLGVTEYAEAFVQKLRLRELDMAGKVRWMMVAYNASANALGIFSPIITFVIFVIIASLNGKALDTETAFTTTALLGLVTHPANMIMSIVPQAVGSLAAFERIQQFLLQPPRYDQRSVRQKVDSRVHEFSPAICVEDLVIQPNSAAAPILSNINLRINSASITICSGAVGSGKTMLLKALMGELAIAGGTMSVLSKRIACCEQSPWLPSGTIKEAICAFSPKDVSWYEQVIQLCCLEEDLLALPNGDQTMIGSHGSNLSGGQRQRVAIARAVYARCEIVLLDDSFSALDGKTESRIAENLLGSEGLFRNIRTTVLLATNSATHFQYADRIAILGHGTIAFQGKPEDLPQDTEQISKMRDDTIEDGPQSPQANKTVQSQRLKVAEAISDISRATGDLSLYGYYLKAVGIHNFLLLLACTSSYSFFITFPQYWLQKWTEAPVSQTRFYIGGYLICSLLAWAATNGSMWCTHIRIAPISGTELHRRLLLTIVGAPLAFFSTTDIGVMLNRFSQDIQLVDTQLPPAALAMSNQTFKLIVQIALLFSAQKFMTLTLPLCVLVVYIVQRVYLRTSRQLRLLDLESQSAVFSSFLESVEGVATIRSFGWEKQAEQANIYCLDKSQQPAYVLFCLQQWLGVVLDLTVAALAAGLIALALWFKGTTTAGQIGMALNIVLVANTTLLGLVTSWTNIEISLGAISRLKSLEADTPTEDKPFEDYLPDESWPSSGHVEISDVTVAYNHESMALEDVTLEVPAGHQMAVCGRTGSGKSTLLLTLLRLLDPQVGSIKVDGIDLSMVPRSLVRQKCFITIAQDVFVLSQASLRFNLDPSASVSDEVIVAALQRTNLWLHFESRAHESSPALIQQVLSSPMSSLPQMSTGQSQLFALARAIIRLRSITQPRYGQINQQIRTTCVPILLLDEATSSVDAETEASMRSIIQQDFIDRGHTVMTIAHRLSALSENLVPGLNYVALLSNGKVEKVGAIEEVLGNALLEK
ncbi:P-loop containing nucleoside triphosphate hydrolase protein [Polychaeton citri CBS 116435]|uniref:P-loop containing nucleoside triphosphate hydrolase protein n=1 Tax=Polychaeton citri CBS 116435 TaxID=1314669 RepID=A0A9P4PZY8_9PEZI|nr:P-loop containing nucleoside triphosphate hydrolase protein [Polychaeton citri CBS 116435]